MNELGIEQLRRDFKRHHPELYQYIVDHEVAKIWDSAGDTVGANDPVMANLFYQRMAFHLTRKSKAFEASRREAAEH